MREITTNIAELDSEHERYNRYERDGYVRPLSKKIGQHVETVTNDIGCVQKMVDCEIQDIPILSTLKTILSNLQICELIIKGSRSKSDDDIIAAFAAFAIHRDIFGNRSCYKTSVESLPR